MIFPRLKILLFLSLWLFVSCSDTEVSSTNTTTPTGLTAPTIPLTGLALGCTDPTGAGPAEFTCGEKKYMHLTCLEGPIFCKAELINNIPACRNDCSPETQACEYEKITRPLGALARPACP